MIYLFDVYYWFLVDIDFKILIILNILNRDIRGCLRNDLLVLIDSDIIKLNFFRIFVFLIVFLAEMLKKHTDPNTRTQHAKHNQSISPNRLLFHLLRFCSFHIGCWILLNSFLVGGGQLWKSLRWLCKIVLRHYGANLQLFCPINLLTHTFKGCSTLYPQEFIATAFMTSEVIRYWREIFV